MRGDLPQVGGARYPGPFDSDDIRAVVVERYERLVAANGPRGGWGERSMAYLQALYSEDEIASLPAEIRDLAMGCGNPGALVNLQAGMTVVDLGAGAGIDVMLAAARVGPSGRVIGVDMTPGLIEHARRAAADVGLANVEFRLGMIEELPLEDELADVVISNCAINLSPEKDRVFREAYRVLRPGGMLAVSDMVAVRDLPPTIVEHPVAWSSCVGGAVSLEEYLGLIQRAGFMRPVVRELETYSADRVAAFKEADPHVLGPEHVLSPGELAALDGCLASARVQTLKVKTCCC